MTKHLPSHTQRIAATVHRPGGITAAEAVAAAEANLETIRERGISDMAATIRTMHALTGQAHSQDLYRLSNGLLGIAGVFGKAGLGDIAHSLCTLIERLSAARCWDQGAVQLHLDSLHLVFHDATGAVQVGTITTALQQVVDRLQPAIGPHRVKHLPERSSAGRPN